jgi:hypothetical protein
VAMLRAAPQAELGRLAVDLVSWESGKDSAGLLRKAARRVHGSDLADVPLVPVLAGDDAKREQPGHHPGARSCGRTPS